ncbi:UNVERIFIED_CONTAM: hypothetical protein RMT77_013383 [Armadillidium vulgare]
MMSPTDESDKDIVINDLLSFVSCKLKLFKHQTILKCIQEFYSKEEGIIALKMLLGVIPTEVAARFQVSTDRHPFISILLLMKNSLSRDLPLFVCKDLNNVPKIEMPMLSECNKFSVERKKEFYMEHQNIKNQLSRVFNSLFEIKNQFQSITEDDGLGLSDDDDEEEDDGIDSSEAEENHPVKDLKFFRNTNNHTAVKIEDDFAKDDMLDQHMNFVTEGLVRSSLKTSKKDISSEEIKDVGEKTPVSSLSPKQKIIHIGMDERVSILDAAEHWSDTLDENEVAHEAEIEINSSPIKSRAENWHYLTCESYFDEVIGNITVFKCSSCEFCSNDESTAMGHTCVKVKEVSLKPKVSNGKLPNHRDKNKKPYECHSCGSTFRMRRDLQKHIEGHVEDGYRCPLCGNRFGIEEWQSHVRICLGNGRTSLEDHYCEICDVFYADKRTLSFHKAYHDPSRPFECRECKYRFYTQKSVEDHFRTHKFNRSNKKCPFCDFRASKQTKIEDHIRCHTGDRPYKCSQCEHSCPTFNALKVHSTSHTLTRNFPCDICGKKFKSQSKVASHRKIHTSERPHKCPVCGKGFKFGLQMTLHHRMHLDIRNHACPHCPYKARTAAILRGHLNTHSQTKPFKCTLCDFGANHKSYLNWHLKYYHPGLQEAPKTNPLPTSVSDLRK